MTRCSQNTVLSSPTISTRPSPSRAILTTNPLPRATASPYSRCRVAPASGARHGVDARPQGAGAFVVDPGEIQKIAAVLMARQAIDRCHRAGRALRCLQNSIDLLDVSDEVDAVRWCCRCRATRGAVQAGRAEAGCCRRKNKRSCLFLYAAVALRATELAASGAVVLSGLTHAGVAMRRMVEYAKIQAAAAAEVTASPARDISAHLKISHAFGIPTANRCCAMPASPCG